MTTINVILDEPNGASRLDTKNIWPMLKQTLGQECFNATCFWLRSCYGLATSECFRIYCDFEMNAVLQNPLTLSDQAWRLILWHVFRYIPIFDKQWCGFFLYSFYSLLTISLAPLLVHHLSILLSAVCICQFFSVVSLHANLVYLIAVSLKSSGPVIPRY